MLTPIKIFTNSDGRDFLVRVVPVGAWRDKEKKFINDKSPGVCFYDTEYADDGTFGPWGQFVARYHVSTMLEHGPNHLVMNGSVANWFIDGCTMEHINKWLYSIVLSSAREKG